MTSRPERQRNVALQESISKRNFIRNIAETSQFGFLIGHGTQVDTIPFRVPSNIHVVFLSDPGYVLDSGIVDSYYRRIVGNLRKFRNFIRGTIPQNEIPNHLRSRNWKWWEHIFQPTSSCPNLTIEFKDDQNPIIDSLLGLRYAGPTGTPVLGLPGSNNQGRKLYGQKYKLSEICHIAAANTRNFGGCILFVTACRIAGEQIPGYQRNIWYPEAGMGMRTAYYAARGRQNYPLPRSTTTNISRQQEATASRLASRKRKMSGLGTARNVRIRTISNNSNSNNFNYVSRKSQVMNMLNNISNTNMNLEKARVQYPNFFRGLSNANAAVIIRNLKRNNTVKNNVRELSIYTSANNINTFRVNSGPIAERIVARMRNMGIRN